MSHPLLIYILPLLYFFPTPLDCICNTR